MDKYRLYPKGSKLWEDGIAYQHWRNMRHLGYRDCPCDLCTRAKQIIDEAIDENKPKRKRGTWVTSLLEGK